MKKEKVIYYNEHGQVDKFTTYINNTTWVLPVFVTMIIILTGLIESI